MSDTAAVDAARTRLLEAGRALAGRSEDEVLGCVGRVLEGWREPASTWRRSLEARLPEAAGFSPEVVREGLARGLAPWSETALRSVFAREMAPHMAAQTAGGGARLVPFELTSLLLAGSIPMPSILACLLPLLLRSPVLVKTASRDRVTAGLVAQSLARVDADLGRCIEVTGFAGDDDDAMARFLDADCVVATGSDETIAAVARRTAPHQRVVLYGHRFSLAVVHVQATRGDQAAELARALALDVALWDQQGCLSPLALYVLGADAAAAGPRMGEALAEALHDCEQRLPRGYVPPTAAAAIAHERAEARMRAAAGGRVRLHASEGSHWTVVCEDEPSMRAAPLHRFLRVHSVPDLDSLARALRPVSRHLAAVAVAGFEAAGQRAESERCLAALGASRLCAPGHMQAPPLGWHHDGHGVLLPLARFCDRE